MPDTKRIEFANTLRGIAVISVLISHYCYTFWMFRDVVAALTNTVPLPIELYPIPYYIQWLSAAPWFNWGAYGVSLFFLISGFVIPFSLRSASSISFCIGRLFRIVPVYCVGFSITLLAIFMAGHYFLKPWLFSPSEVFIHYIPGIRDLMGSRNIDGIIWTLEVEIKFYCICAAFAVLFRKGSNQIFLIPIGLFAFSILVYSQASGLGVLLPWLYEKLNAATFSFSFMVFMFIGVIFNYLHRNLISLKNTMILIPVFGIMFCLMWWFGIHQGSFSQAWSYGLALATFCLAYFRPKLFRSNRIFDFFADISYPLYVIHGLPGYIALRILLDRGVKAWMALLGVTIVVTALAWVMHVLLEMPLQQLGKQLGKRFAIQSP